LQHPGRLLHGGETAQGRPVPVHVCGPDLPPGQGRAPACGDAAGKGVQAHRRGGHGQGICRQDRQAEVGQVDTASGVLPPGYRGHPLADCERSFSFTRTSSMQRTIVQFSLLCLLAVAIGSAAASDVITYRDGKKATGQEQPGTIQDESITSVVIMPNLKNTPKTIDAADIINIVYEEPLKTKDAKDAYRKAVNAETAADRAGANAPNRKQ